MILKFPELITRKERFELFLNNQNDMYRNIVRRSLIHRHCGEQMIKIQEIHHYKRNEKLGLNKLKGKIFYCYECGHHFDNYPFY
jgi:hypothetical protein